MCSDCHLLLKESAPSCVYVNADVVRKYAEESCCNKQLPEKLEKRVWMMFGIKEVIAIDDEAVNFSVSIDEKSFW